MDDEKHNLPEGQPGSPDDLTLGLPTPSNFYFGHRRWIAPSQNSLLRFTPTPRHSEKEGKFDTSSAYQEISRLWPEISGAETRPGSRFFSAEKIHVHTDVIEIPKVLKYDRCVLQAPNASQWDIALKSILVSDDQSSMTQHGDWPLLRARQKLGRSGGMWTDLWSPKGVHVVVRRTPLVSPLTDGA